MARKRQVAIIGAGPAGIFAALALSDVPGVNVRVFDKGPDIDVRQANSHGGGAARDPRWMLCGSSSTSSFP